MKFMTEKLGQTGLLISLCVIVSACNPEEYYPTEEFIQGIDSYCSEAKDADSCSAIHWCQPAYNDGGDTPETMEFAGCVANPDFVPPSDGSTAGSTSGGSSTAGSTDGSATAGSTDGSVAGGTAGGSTTGGSTGGTTGGTDGSTAGGTAGGSTTNGGNNGNGNGGGNNGNGNGGGNGGSVGTGPIADAYSSKCANLDEKYLFVKKLVSKKETKKVVKVKVCHVTGNSSAHTIVIACPALKGHIPHEDYLGSCDL